SPYTTLFRSCVLRTMRARTTNAERFRNPRRHCGFNVPPDRLCGRGTSRLKLFPAGIGSKSSGIRAELMQSPFQIADERVPMIDLERARGATELSRRRANISDETSPPSTPGIHE